MRVSFSLITGLGTNIKLSSLMNIFEKVVEPILLYNCEITQALYQRTGHIRNLKIIYGSRMIK